MSEPEPRPSFDDVYATYARYVWALLVRFGVRRADAEDVCQEVFAVIYRRLPEFEGRSALSTWVYAIAFRCASDYRRRAWVRREQISGDDVREEIAAPDIDSPVESLEMAARRRMLEQVLEELDDAHRAVFVLYELQELQMTDVVAVVGCPLKTGYSRLATARDLVRASLRRRIAREGAA